MTNPLPVGPARVRASDAEREQVVAFLRRNWHEGRLSDEELDQRVGRALASRTLGELRHRVADLPAPPETRGERARRGAGWLLRALGTARGIAAAVGIGFVALAVLGAIVGDQSDTGSSSGSPAPSGPSGFSAPAGSTASDEPPPPEPKTTKVALGKVGTDGKMDFRVRRVRTVKSVPLRRDRDGGSYAAGANRALIVADVTTFNRANRPADPFCGSLGAQLQVAGAEAVELVQEIYRFAGNENLCSGGLQPEQREDVKLVFQVAAGDKAQWLDVWNGGEPGDILGKTRLRVDL